MIVVSNRGIWSQSVVLLEVEALYFGVDAETL